QRHAQAVVQKGQEQILANGRRGRPTEPAGAQDSHQITFHERYAGAFHGDVGPGAHRDAHVGPGERRRIVDAVAGHRDLATLAVESRYDLALLLGQHFGDYFIDPELPGDGFSSPATVAGEHDQAQSLRMQLLDRIAG